MRIFLRALCVALVLSSASLVIASDEAAKSSATRLFAVEFKTGPAWNAAKPPNEQVYFKEHSANLKQLRDRGVLIVGARYADKGFIVLSAASADEASAMIKADPAVQHGTFVYELHEFKVFYPGTLARN